MSAKPKAFLKHAKSKQKKEQKLETADDYQAAGVEFEEAAGKWRAGDAVKSMRFFQRALDVYEQGLQKFPGSLDLSYNKARVQLEIATHPILVRQLQVPVLEVLQQALQSHRYALSLDSENADSLFNTSQVLTSIAEELAKSNKHADADALPLLEEALDLQTRCLAIQELKFEESLQQQDQNVAGDPIDETSTVDTSETADTSSEPATNIQEEQWFSIVEPVTQDTLIDTILTQLGTLTTLCGILSSSPEAAPQATLAWIEETSAKLLNRLSALSTKDNPEQQAEIALTKANFISSLLEAGYRTSKIDATTYKRERDAAFAVPELNLKTTPEALLAKARSLISFNAALTETPSPNPSIYAPTRWTALSTTIADLTAASKIPGINPTDQAKTHFLRADTSFLQHTMKYPPTSHQPAITNAPQLLKNAEVFYRNASKLSLDVEEKEVAGFRSGVAVYIQRRGQGESDAVEILKRAVPANKGERWMVEQLEDMLVEGLLPDGFQVL